LFPGIEDPEQNRTKFGDCDADFRSQKGMLSLPVATNQSFGHMCVRHRTHVSHVVPQTPGYSRKVFLFEFRDTKTRRAACPRRLLWSRASNRHLMTCHVRSARCPSIAHGLCAVRKACLCWSDPVCSHKLQRMTPPPCSSRDERVCFRHRGPWHVGTRRLERDIACGPRCARERLQTRRGDHPCCDGHVRAYVHARLMTTVVCFVRRR